MTGAWWAAARARACSMAGDSFISGVRQVRVDLVAPPERLAVAVAV
jgi:hypothetical protein